MKTFTYKDDLYIRCVPSKMLCRSTLIWEVVNRGDIFALRVRDQVLTIISGTAEVEHSEHGIIPSHKELFDDLEREVFNQLAPKTSA